MDAFFVGVELRRRPELSGLPVIVGGTGPRSVVAAASYAARAHGVHSALAMSIARRRCPEAIVLPGDMASYRDASSDVMAIFRDVTPLVEPLSLDEAFLDVSGAWRPHGSASALAAVIRERVKTQTELDCCVGVAQSKFLAKLASQDAKPTPGPTGPIPGSGVFTIAPGFEIAYLHPLPVRRMWGVGPTTALRLADIAVVTVGDLAELELEQVVAALGKSVGEHLHRLANGIDERPVEPDREVKSIGHEETFPTDVFDSAQLDSELVRLSGSVAQRLREADRSARTTTLKVRFGDFETVTRSATTEVATHSATVIARTARRLLATLDSDLNVIGRGIRLIGVSAGGLVAEQVEQLSLGLGDGAPVVDESAGDGGTRAGQREPEPAPEREWGLAEDAVHEIRRKFGRGSIGTGKPGVQAPTERPVWGPDKSD